MSSVANAIMMRTRFGGGIGIGNGGDNKKNGSRQRNNNQRQRSKSPRGGGGGGGGGRNNTRNNNRNTINNKNNQNNNNGHNNNNNNNNQKGQHVGVVNNSNNDTNKNNRSHRRGLSPLRRNASSTSSTRGRAAAATRATTGAGAPHDEVDDDYDRRMMMMRKRNSSNSSNKQRQQRTATTRRSGGAAAAVMMMMSHDEDDEDTGVLSNEDDDELVVLSVDQPDDEDDEDEDESSFEDGDLPSLTRRNPSNTRGQQQSVAAAATAAAADMKQQDKVQLPVFANKEVEEEVEVEVDEALEVETIEDGGPTKSKITTTTTTTRRKRPSSPRGANRSPVASSTARPSTPDKQRTFWGQLDPDFSNDETAGTPKDEEQQDQLRKQQQGQQRRQIATPGGRGQDMSTKQSTDEYNLDTTDDEDDDDDEESEAVTSSTRNTNNSATTPYNNNYGDGEELYTSIDDMESTFCDQALNAIGDICAGLVTNGGSSPDRITTGTSNERGVVAAGGATTPKRRQDRKNAALSSLSRSRPIVATRSLSMVESEIQVEHTAIEVEFVEPPPPVPPVANGGGANNNTISTVMSAEKKNAYLTAMAKKAKEDFERNKKQEQHQVERTATTATATMSGDSSNTFAVMAGSSHNMMSSTTTIDPNSSITRGTTLLSSSASSSVMSENGGAGAGASSGIAAQKTTFTLTEKRKYLKFISSGMSTSAAIKSVLDDRAAAVASAGIPTATKNGKVVHSSSSETTTTNTNNTNNNDKSRGNGPKATTRGPRLAFWKRERGSSAPTAAAAGALVAEGNKSSSRSASVDHNAREAALIVDAEEDLPQEEEEEDGGKAGDGKMDIVQDEGEEEDDDDDSDAPDDERKSVVEGGDDGGVDLMLVSAIDNAIAPSASSGDEASPQRFARSGIKYYDAVRQSESTDYEDFVAGEINDIPMRSVSAARGVMSAVTSPKSGTGGGGMSNNMNKPPRALMLMKGQHKFEELKDQSRSKSAPRAGRPTSSSPTASATTTTTAALTEEDPSLAASPRDVREFESSLAGTLSIRSPTSGEVDNANKKVSVQQQQQDIVVAHTNRTTTTGADLRRLRRGISHNNNNVDKSNTTTTTKGNTNSTNNKGFGRHRLRGRRGEKFLRVKSLLKSPLGGGSSNNAKHRSEVPKSNSSAVSSPAPVKVEQGSKVEDDAVDDQPTSFGSDHEHAVIKEGSKETSSPVSDEERGGIVLSEAVSEDAQLSDVASGREGYHDDDGGRNNVSNWLLSSSSPRIDSELQYGEVEPLSSPKSYSHDGDEDEDNINLARKAIVGNADMSGYNGDSSRDAIDYEQATQSLAKGQGFEESSERDEPIDVATSFEEQHDVGVGQVQGSSSTVESAITGPKPVPVENVESNGAMMAEDEVQQGGSDDRSESEAAEQLVVEEDQRGLSPMVENGSLRDGELDVVDAIAVKENLLMPTLAVRASEHAYVVAGKLQENGERGQNKTHTVNDTTVVMSNVPTTVQGDQQDRATHQRKAAGSVYIENSMDVSMDTYFHSMGFYNNNRNNSSQKNSKADNSSHNDGVSVHTNGSSYTQGSRLRRRGAAAKRLAMAKMSENKVKGWHESMREAAFSSNRAWDPTLGFVDYVDPEMDKIDEKSNERLRVDLNRTIRRKKKDSASDMLAPEIGNSVAVPFPEEWEKERSEMLAGSSVQNEAMYSDGQEDKARQQNVHSSSTPSMLPEGTSWFESMQMASSAIAKDGRSWDPVNGWSHEIKKRSSVPDVVDFDVISATSAIEANNEHQAFQELRKGPIHEIGLDAHDGMVDHGDRDRPAAFGQVLHEEKLHTSEEWDEAGIDAIETYRGGLQEAHQIHAVTPESVDVASKEGDDETKSGSGVNPELSTAASDWQESPLHVPSKDSYRGMTESLLLAHNQQSMGGEIDVPQRSLQKELAGIDPGPEREGSGQSFPSLTDNSLTPPSSAVVDIKREKIDAEDLELFSTHSPTSAKGARGGLTQYEKATLFLPPRNPDAANSGQSVCGSPRSVVSAQTTTTVSTRRGAGPVDVDEVDENWDSDDDKRCSEGWNPGDQPGNSFAFQSEAEIPFSGGWESADEQLAVNVSAGSGSSNSGSSSSRFSKKVVKLKGCKRDTSPIRVAKTSSSDKPLVSVTRTTDTKDPPSPRLLVVTRDERMPKESIDFVDNLADDINYEQRASIIQQDAPFSDGKHHEVPSGFVHRGFSGNEDDASSADMDDRQQSRPDGVDAQLVAPASKEIFQQRVANVPSVRARLQQWESLAAKSEDSQDYKAAQRPAGTAEWKSFLGKKVRAESAAANQHKSLVVAESDGDVYGRGSTSDSGNSKDKKDFGEEDSLFEFIDPSRSSPVNQPSVASSEMGFSNLSPIRKNDSPQEKFVTKRDSRKKELAVSFEPQPMEKNADRLGDVQHATTRQTDVIDGSNSTGHDSDEYEESEAYGPAPGEKRSFFQRLTECAAPVMAQPSQHGTGKDQKALPAAHIAFLRDNSQATTGNDRFSAPAFCGRPDVVDDDEKSLGSPKRPEVKRTGEEKKTRSLSASRGRTGPGSVISDDFGAKTAYLEAIAMRTAVSRPRSSSRRRGERSSTASVASSTSSNNPHSERWKAYLERKRTQTPNKARGSGTSEVSRAAEKYAAEKVEEMMSTMMSSRSHSAQTDGSGSHLRADSNEEAMKCRTSASARAAEDLAAARVEAMMAALSNSAGKDETEM